MSQYQKNIKYRSIKMLNNSTMSISSNNPKSEKYAKTSGILLIICGISEPVIALLATIAISGDDPEKGLIALATIPLMIIPVWLIPIIGGIFAIKRKKYTFVYVSSIIAWIYWIPSGILTLGGLSVGSLWALYCLPGIPLMLLTIPASKNLSKAKEGFKNRKFVEDTEVTLTQ
jgi:hypothetical protein